MREHRTTSRCARRAALSRRRATGQRRLKGLDVSTSLAAHCSRWPHRHTSRSGTTRNSNDPLHPLHRPDRLFARRRRARARRLRRLDDGLRVVDRPRIFFVSSTGSGRGADLGGLAGADRLCTSLASAAGAGNRTWRAYLSTTPGPGDARAVNARDRIGTGPWRNAKGVVIAQNVDRAARHEQHHQADGADREGRGRQRPRRQAEHARHPHRLAARRHGDRRQRRHHLRQLDQERRRRGDGRPPRSHRPRRERAGEVVELVAPVARLQPSRR